MKWLKVIRKYGLVLPNNCIIYLLEVNLNSMSEGEITMPEMPEQLPELPIEVEELEVLEEESELE